MTDIVTKNSVTPGAVPAGSSLLKGELAVNAVDGKLFTSSDGVDVVPIQGSDWKPGTDPNDIENTNSGNVGIGTSVPNQKLVVNGIIATDLEDGVANYIARRTGTPLLAEDKIARWTGHGPDPADPDVVGARIDMVAEADWSNALSGHPTRFEFHNSRDSSAITEAMRIHSDEGKVSIGTTDKLAHVSIANGATSGTLASGSANELMIDSASNCGMTIGSGPASEGNIKFGRIDNNTACVLSYEHAEEKFIIRTIGNEMLTVNAATAGDMWVGLGASINPPNSGMTVNESGYTWHSVEPNGTSQVVNINFAQNGVSRGNISTTDSRVYYNITSDYRLKENVVPIANALGLLEMLQPCEFNFKGSSQQVGGFIAHEVQEIIPDLVSGEKDGPEMQTLDEAKMMSYVVAAIQELSAKVEALS